MMMEAVRTSETSVHFYDTAMRYIPEGCHLHTRLSENLKSHNLIFFHAPTSYAFMIHSNIILCRPRWSSG
jgi:hypothetical protein